MSIPSPRSAHGKILNLSNRMTFRLIGKPISNKVYFNIWSACSYATGNNTLPIFQNWTQTCTSSNVDLDSSTATANTNGGLGIDIPAWSLLDVPGNSTFDVQRAVSSAYMAAFDFIAADKLVLCAF